MHLKCLGNSGKKLISKNSGVILFEPMTYISYTFYICSSRARIILGI
jgi:hypothetical protein